MGWDGMGWDGVVRWWREMDQGTGCNADGNGDGDAMRDAISSEETLKASLRRDTPVSIAAAGSDVCATIKERYVSPRATPFLAYLSPKSRSPSNKGHSLMVNWGMVLMRMM